MVGPRGAFPGMDGSARHHGVRLIDPGSCVVSKCEALTQEEWLRQQPTSQPDTSSQEDREMGRRRLAEEQKPRGFNQPRASRVPRPQPLTHTIGEAVTQDDCEAAAAAAYAAYQQEHPEPCRASEVAFAATPTTDGLRRKPGEGRLIAVQEGKPYKGTTYHLFHDCGYLTGPMQQAATNQQRARGEATELTPWRIRDLSDDVIEVLALKVCSTCDNRTKLLTLDDVLDLFFNGHLVVRDPNTIKRFRRNLVSLLDEYGFVIRQVHKNQPQLRTEDEE